jgi:uncharacterized tellurite resistance protein B-like protein
MISLLQRLFGPDPAPLTRTDADLALAALLVRVARTDGLYAFEEVERIDRVLMARHGVGSFEAAALRAEAEKVEAEAPDNIRFTRWRWPCGRSRCRMVSAIPMKTMNCA